MLVARANVTLHLHQAIIVGTRIFAAPDDYTLYTLFACRRRLHQDSSRRRHLGMKRGFAL